MAAAVCRRHGLVRCPKAEGARGQERQTEASARRCQARQHRAEGTLGIEAIGRHWSKDHGERIHRKLERQPARRAAERGNLRHPGRHTPKDRPLALRLQRCRAALPARQPDAARSAPDACTNQGRRTRRTCHETNPQLPISDRQNPVMNKRRSTAGHNS